MGDPSDPFALADAVNERIFREQIVPAELAGVTAHRRPRVVFIVGQPGAGKTAAASAVLDTLSQRGEVGRVDSDLFKAYHPAYADLLAEDDQVAAVRVSQDGRRWAARAEEYLRERRADIVVDTTVQNPGYGVQQLRGYRRAGYRVETVFLAVPAAQSRLGILARYHDQVAAKGSGRLTPTAKHDASYTGVVDFAAAVDADRLADVVQVIRRGNRLLYSNELAGTGEWMRAAATGAAIVAERERVLTHVEARDLLVDLERLATAAGPEWASQLREVAALADPLLPPGARAAARDARVLGQPGAEITLRLPEPDLGLDLDL